MRTDPSSYAIRLQQVLFGVVVLGLGAMATRSMMAGGSGDMVLVVGGIVGITVLLLMDRHYWMLCPLALWGRGVIAVPGFDVVELGCMAVIGAHFVRRALHREGRNVFRPAVFWAAPYFIWVVVIYIMNPSGIFLFGSSTIGARFYLKLLLGFWVTMVLSVQRLDEDDCRRLFRSTVILLSASLAMTLVGEGFASTDEGGSAYELLTAASLSFWLVSRYRLTQFLQLSWRPLVLVLLGAMTLYTGKRRAVFNIIIYPLLRALIARRDRGAAALLTVVALGVVGVLVAGQGQLYELPISMQRGLSMLPGRWDSSLEVYAGGKDPFREYLRGYAWEEVERSPWFGRKGFAIDVEEIRWINFSETTKNYAGHGAASNWHNTWIGMMADFGVPGAVGWGIFSIGMLLVGFRKLRGCVSGSYQQTVVIYCLGYFVLSLLASHTSGHSALVPFYIWPTFGLLLGITPPSEAAELDRRSRFDESAISDPVLSPPPTDSNGATKPCTETSV